MSSQTRAVNMHREPCDVRVDRGHSRWGNPFRIGQDGTRGEVIAMYEDWLLSELEKPGAIQEFLKLRGKSLGCHCKPKPCHVDIIVKHIERLSSPMLNFI